MSSWFLSSRILMLLYLNLCYCEYRLYSHNSLLDSIHQPLYPPGRIIHIVRHHAKDRAGGRRAEPAYQGVWADNKDFDEVSWPIRSRRSNYIYQSESKILIMDLSEAFVVILDQSETFLTIGQSQVLISKRMLQDHMPDNVLDALEKVSVWYYPPF